MDQKMTDHSNATRITVFDFNNKLSCKYWIHITEQPAWPIPESILLDKKFEVIPKLPGNQTGTPFMASVCSLIRFPKVENIPAIIRLLAWGALEPEDGRVIEQPGVYLMERVD